LYAILRQIATAEAARHEIDLTIKLLREASTKQASFLRSDTIYSSLVAILPGNMLLYSLAMYALVPAVLVGELIARYGESVKPTAVELWAFLRAVSPKNVTFWNGSKESLINVAQTAPAMVFCGSLGTANRLLGKLNPHTLFLDLGSGVNPFVVTASANVEAAAEIACTERVFNTGCDCLCPDIFLVEESVLNSFISELSERVRALPKGALNDDTTRVCPIRNEAGVRRSNRFIKKFQTRIVFGGACDVRSGVIDPTIIVHAAGDFHEPPEFFSPIWNVVPYRSEQELSDVIADPVMLARANAISIFGKYNGNVPTMYSVIAANTSLQQMEDGNAPFGGFGGGVSFAAINGVRYNHPILVARELVQYMHSHETTGDKHGLSGTFVRHNHVTSIGTQSPASV
jgi:aldehyde dehydrogenase (NAD+)